MIVIDVNFGQLERTVELIVLQCVPNLPIVTDDKFRHSEKAAKSIVRTLSGIIIDVNLSQFLKHPFSIKIKLLFSGNIKVINWSQLKNALFSIVLKVEFIGSIFTSVKPVELKQLLSIVCREFGIVNDIKFKQLRKASYLIVFKFEFIWFIFTVVKPESLKQAFSIVCREFGIVNDIKFKQLKNARVSSHGQINDLERQKDQLKKQYPEHILITDIGSGINLNKYGIRKIVKLAIAGKIEELVIMHKDRLVRFGYELIEDLIKEYSGGKITIVNKKEDITPEEEMAMDVLQIMNVFTAKMNGLRKYKNK